MQSTFIEYVYLILIILGLVMLANKFRIAYPIVLVLGGLVISFIPSFSNITISPELVFFIFLPPLLYEAAWQVSWKELWKYRRIITSFAFPIVIITSCVVALVSTALIPGFTLALGFLLGGIISPPDAIAATTIMRQAKAPKLVIGVTEGESLLNDATSLIIFRFALAAVLTGHFHLGEASVNFFLVVVLGILIGLAVGFVIYCIHRWLPVTPGIDIALTLATPYCMYFAAEYFHESGVLAVVSGGLLLSGKRLSMLTYMSRIQGINVWNSVVFVLNGLVFMLIGLQLPSIVNQLGDTSLTTAIVYGLVVSFVLIVARLICTYGAAVITIFMSRFITVADARPGWKAPFLFGWAGIRGVVSLAAALSVPLLGSNNEGFPYRNLILFITFIVILVTLVLQGLTLPWLIKKLNMDDRQVIPLETQEKIIRKKIAHASLELLDKKYDSASMQNEELLNLKSRLKIEMDFFNRELSEPDKAFITSRNEFQQLYLEMLEHQRKLLDTINHNSEFDEDIIRKYQLLTDMEEYKVREKYSQSQG
jgi:Na+/H+ antiporter